MGGLAATALLTLAHCKANSSEENACSSTQALSATFFRGSSLPPKTIALTFDDGPGDRTAELSLYLRGEGIPAVFFVNGKRIDGQAGPVLQGLVDDGHLVANHTETHDSLTGTATGTTRLSAEAVTSELTDTDLKITPYIPSQRFLFRPPFGDFDQETFAVLSPTPMNKYVGPIGWDVGDRMDEANGRAADWDCWQDGSDGKRLSVQQCGDLYLTEIKRQGRGIVLMHDPYFDESNPNREGTVDMVKYMVPLLKAEGFTFVRADRVPDIEALLPAWSEDAGAGEGGTVPPENTQPTPGPGETPPGTTPPAGDPCPPASTEAQPSMTGESGNLRPRR